MTGGFSAHLTVGGVIHMATAVTAGGLKHPWKVLKIMLKTPETTTSKHRRLCVGHHG